jgi:DNA-binding NtrC family response regulator
MRFDSTPKQSDDATFGLKILEELVRRWPDPEAAAGNSKLPIIMLTTFSRQERASQANRAGAQAYVEKELNRERLRELLGEYGLIEDRAGIMVGRSLSLLKVLREARRIARTESGNALILGPQGAGKTTMARYIHQQSGRPGALVEFYSSPSAAQIEYQALFGCWQGAHSTATESVCGKAEEAHQGTLLIDEVHNLKHDTQQELLRFGRPDRSSGWRSLRRLGNFPTSPERAVNQANRSVRGERNPADSSIAVDVLLLSATNEPLDDPEWRASNGFTEPLYTRLAIESAGKPLRLPNLAQRREDIPILFEHFLRRETEKAGGRTNGAGTKAVDPEVMKRLQEYSWPRNVVELNSVASAVARNSRDFTDVYLRHLPPFDEAARKSTPAPASHPASPQTPGLDDAERVLRSAEVPSSLAELQGKLPSLHNAYGSLVKKILEIALREMKSARGDDFCLPAMRLLFGDRIKKTADAYSELLRLKARFFEDDPPSPDSILEAALRRAELNRNPKGRRAKQESAAE